MSRAVMANGEQMPGMGMVMLESALGKLGVSGRHAPQLGSVVSWVLAQAGVERTGLVIDRDARQLTSEQLRELMSLGLEESHCELAGMVEALLKASRNPGDDGEIAEAALRRAMQKWANCLEGIGEGDPEVRAHNAAVILAEMLGVRGFASGFSAHEPKGGALEADQDPDGMWRDEDGVSLAERQSRLGRRRSFSQDSTR